MTQWTDVLITFEVEGDDMTTVTQPHVTFAQGNTVVDVTDITITDAQNFSLWLTQEQTGHFLKADVEVQLNYFNSVGKRVASDIGIIPVNSNLLRRILENGG